MNILKLKALQAFKSLPTKTKLLQTQFMKHVMDGFIYIDKYMNFGFLMMTWKTMKQPQDM